VENPFTSRDSMVATTTNLQSGLLSKWNIKNVPFENLRVFKPRLVRKGISRSLLIPIAIHCGQHFDETSGEGCGSVLV
jgi:hypothetical protein